MSVQPHFPFLRPPSPYAAPLLPNPAQEEARAWLDRPADWPLRRLVLWGGAGSGKSHLLHAWAGVQGGRVLTSLPQGFPAGPVALDGIEGVDETGLFHLVNAAHEARHPLLMSARMPPGQMAIGLPDLASRLRATMAVSIGPAGDDFLAMLLARLLAERQLRLDAPLQTWLLTRLQRNPGAVRAAVERLDAAGLESGRSITRALASRVLGFDDNLPGLVAEGSPGRGGVG